MLVGTDTPVVYTYIAPILSLSVFFLVVVRSVLVFFLSFLVSFKLEVLVVYLSSFVSFKFEGFLMGVAFSF